MKTSRVNVDVDVDLVVDLDGAMDVSATLVGSG